MKERIRKSPRLDQTSFACNCEQMMEGYQQTSTERKQTLWREGLKEKEPVLTSPCDDKINDTGERYRYLITGGIG